jgi:hypothetical protein
MRVYLLREIDHVCTKICICAGPVAKENQIATIVEQARELFAQKQLGKEEKMLASAGVYSFEKTYRTKSFEINPWLQIMPSQSSLLKILKDIRAEISSQKNKQAFSNTDDSKAELRLSKMEPELEGINKQLIRLIRKEKNNPHLLIGLDCKPSESVAVIDINALEKLPVIIKFIDLIKSFVPKSVVLRNCVDLEYNTKSFKLIGGFPLPTKIPMPEKVLNRLGEANMSGLTLSFKDSPLGIKTIEIGKLKGRITISATFSSRMHITRRILRQIYERGVQTADLFIEVIED